MSVTEPPPEMEVEGPRVAPVEMMLVQGAPPTAGESAEEMGSYPGLSSDVSGGNTPPPQPQAPVRSVRVRSSLSEAAPVASIAQATECMRPRVEATNKESLRRGTLVQTYDEMDWEKAYVPSKNGDADAPETHAPETNAVPKAAVAARTLPAKPAAVLAEVTAPLPSEPVANLVGQGGAPPATAAPSGPAPPVPLPVTRVAGAAPLQGYVVAPCQPAPVQGRVPVTSRTIVHPAAPPPLIPSWAMPSQPVPGPMPVVPNRSSSVPHVRNDKRVAAPVSWIPVPQYAFMSTKPIVSAEPSKLSSSSQRPVQEWQETEVCQWLTEVFLAPKELVQMVEEQAISGKVLLSLSERDFQELPVPKFGHRRLLMLAAHELRKRQASQASSVQPVSAVAYSVQAPSIPTTVPAFATKGASGPQLSVGGGNPHPSQVSMRSTLPPRCAAPRRPQVQASAMPMPAGSWVAGVDRFATPRVMQSVAAPSTPASARQVQLPVASPRDTVEDEALFNAAMGRSRSMSPQSRPGGAPRMSPSHRFAWEPLASTALTQL